MDNYDISDALGFYAKLAELHDENPFKVKAFASAAFNLKKVKEPLEGMDDEALTKVPGVGKSVISAVKQILHTGSFADLDSVIQKTPQGILEMLRIKGLGPKKVQGIWRNMEIDNVEDLFNACRENRLVEQPGFGLKTQGEVMRAIEFSWGAKGKYHYARVEKIALDLLAELKNDFPDALHSITGEMRRKCEVVESIDLITTADPAASKQCFLNNGLLETDNGFTDSAGYHYRIFHSNKDNFYSKLFETTGSDQHLQLINYVSGNNVNSEEEIYASLKEPFVEPEMRERLEELERVRSGKATGLLQFSDLKGILHNHSTYSDGLQSLQEMAEYCRELDYEYLGICDHSKSAGYANGLQVARVLDQHAEIDKLNATMHPFRIFKGIESDILNDGSLDYEPEILAKFDLVVASVHSNLKMQEDVANNRLKKAIENPYTHILGHPTGRLLLLREGYKIDHAYIIDACAANGVAIELNANPYRLDLDWRWVGYAMDKGVMVSINPDAHEKHAYHDMYFGTLAARKGGLTKEFTLNAFSLGEMETWLKNKRNQSIAGH
ncbi:MAG: DNA polymerase/3'-5' exonuclease PolX [Bacteroidetes bacterium]|nr:DNA polymerase/3'-5' exonuclease PolX [Bacteroidota bacterium]